MKCKWYLVVISILVFIIPSSNDVFADDYTEQQFSLLTAAGPWPPKIIVDPGNRYNGVPKAIELGEFLFRNPNLSRSKNISCVTCHDPEQFYTDGLALSKGVSITRRNSPTVINTTFQRWFGWDGSSDSLWSQSIRPLLSPLEMDSDGSIIRALYQEDEDFRLAFTETFGMPPEDANDEQILVLTAKALASYQHSLISEPSVFDRYRIAIISGESVDRSEFSVSASAGANLFFGSANCALCHFGALFTNNEFANIGLSHIDANGQVDKGRFSGIK